MEPILIVDDGHPGVGVGGLGPLIQFTENRRELGSRGVQIGHGPGLQGLGQDGVVGIGAGRRHLVRRLVKGQPPFHQQPHQLRDDHRGVGVVDLDDHVVGQGVRGKAPLLQLRQDQLRPGGHQEILLIHPQQPPGLVAVVGIEEGGQVVPDIPLVKVDTHPGGVSRVGQVEQVQPVGAAAARPGDGDVIHDSRHLGVPQRDGERPPRLDEPAVTLEPGVRLLRLLAPGEHLAEQAEVIIQAHAVPGQPQGGNGVQKAGGQTAQAAVAQTCVRLFLIDAVQADVSLGQSLLGSVIQAQIEQAHLEAAAHQELHAQVVDLLGAGADGLGLELLMVLAHHLAADEGQSAIDLLMRCNAQVHTILTGELVLKNFCKFFCSHK